MGGRAPSAAAPVERLGPSEVRKLRYLVAVVVSSSSLTTHSSVQEERCKGKGRRS